MSESVYTSEQEIVIIRHVGIQEFICFHPFYPFHRNHHSRSLEGSIRSGRDLLGIRSREARISDLIEFRCSRVNSGIQA